MASNLMLLRPHKELLPEVRLCKRLLCTICLVYAVPIEGQSRVMFEGMQESSLDVTLFPCNVTFKR